MKGKCLSIRELLSSYIDNTASKREVAKICKHLDECAECKKYLDELNNMVQGLRGLDSLEAPASIEDKVITRIDDMEKSPPLYRRLLRPSYVTLSALVVCTVAVLVVFLVKKEQKQMAPELFPQEQKVRLEEILAKGGKIAQKQPRQTEEQRQALLELLRQAQQKQQQSAANRQRPESKPSMADASLSEAPTPASDVSRPARKKAETFKAKAPHKGAWERSSDREPAFIFTASLAWSIADDEPGPLGAKMQGAVGTFKAEAPEHGGAAGIGLVRLEFKQDKPLQIKPVEQYAQQVSPPLLITDLAGTSIAYRARKRLPERITIRLGIDSAGAVSWWRFYKGYNLEYSLRNALIQQFKTWRFEPARAAGKPVEADLEISLEMIH